ncbi:MAG TPA: hypothetical protein DCX54_11790 [Flavobacteriales bacterium]|nr:hypothetical protein [Flavobacteriales bacterium]
MKIESKFILALINYRITIISLFFAALMIFSFLASLIFGVTSESFEASKTIINNIPTLIFTSALFILVFYVTTGILKAKLERESNYQEKNEDVLIKSYEEAMTFDFMKLRIFMACQGSFVALTIIATVFCIALGFKEKIETVYTVLFYFGEPLWLLATWRFFSRKLN